MFLPDKNIAKSCLLLFHFTLLVCFAQAQIVAKKYFPYLKLETSNPDKIKYKEYNILPLLYRSPETGIATGVVLVALFKAPGTKDTNTRTSNIGIPLIISEAGQKIAIVQSNLMFNKDNIFWRSLNIIEDFTEQYWGVGNKSNWDDWEIIRYNLFRIQHRISTRIYKKHYLGIQYQLYNAWDIIGERTLYQPDALGNQGYIASGFGLGYLYDSRDNIVNTANGLYLDIGSYFYNHFFLSNYNFNSYRVDLRQFFSLSAKSVLAYQAILDHNDGEVPFMQMAHMGGAVAMRGLYYGRFRDKIHHTLQAEYRLKFNSWFGMALFGGLGNVSPDYEHYSLGTLRVAGGGGLRFSISKVEKVNVRLDFGISEMDTRLNRPSYGIYFHVGEAF